MAKERVKLTRPPIITEAFRKAAETARVDAYQLDLGLEQPMTAFILYGRSGGWSKKGGNKSARAMADNIVDAVNEEIEAELYGPVLIMGDFNAVPDSLDSVRELLE